MFYLDLLHKLNICEDKYEYDRNSHTKISYVSMIRLECSEFAK